MRTKNEVIIIKIFQVVPYFPPSMGGMEVYVKSISEGLVARGNEVTVFTTSDVGYPYSTKVNGVEVRRLRTLVKFYNVPIAPSVFLEMLKEEKPDIIHAHQYPVFFSDMSAIISRLRDIPLVLHIHVVAEPKSTFSSLASSIYYRTSGKLAFNTSQRVIVPSFAYSALLGKMGVKRKKIRIIPYGIDLSRFHLKNDDESFRKLIQCSESKLILTVGRLSYQKGFQYLISAMPIVLREIPNAKLVIVGEGEQFAYLSGLVQSLDLTTSVIFTGSLTNEKIPMAYAAADVFVLPSMFESFGLVLVEAQAAGKPVIATRVGGTIEALIENKTGLLVDRGNPEQLAKAILLVLLNKDLARKMGENGIRFVNEKFDINNNVKNVVSLYKELLDNSA